MIKNVTKTFTLTLPITAPLMVSAGTFNPDWVLSFLYEVGALVSSLIPLLIGVALLAFMWGVVQLMLATEENKRSEAKRKLVWGLISLFVIVSVWGLVALVQVLMGIQGARTWAPQSDFGETPISGSYGGGGDEGGECTAEIPCSDGVGFCNSPCCPDNPSYPAGCDNVDN